MENNKDWSQYYKATGGKPPRPLLVKAIEYLTDKNEAIDIGAGALNDTKYLLEQGFNVTAIDKSPIMEQETKNISGDKLQVFTVGFEDFDFPENKYDIASAMYSLPFIDPSRFDSVFTKIKNSLKINGIFCGQFFGIKDEWSNNTKMIFHTEEQIKKLLNGFEIISLKEIEEDGKTAAGQPKHWHVFHLIARKN